MSVIPWWQRALYQPTAATGKQATIVVEDGRYCIRKQLIAIDFSGIVKGHGMDNAVIDIDAPVLDMSKGGVRRQDDWGGGIAFFDYERGNRDIEFRNLIFNVAEGTVVVSRFTHGLLSFHETIQTAISDEDRFDGIISHRSAFEAWGCPWSRPEGFCLYVAGEWAGLEYTEDTGVDLSTLPWDECIQPVATDIPLDSPQIDASGKYIGDDLENLPSHSVTLKRVRYDLHGRAHNDVLMAIGQYTFTAGGFLDRCLRGGLPD